jgi:hypothetical protein
MIQGNNTYRLSNRKAAIVILVLVLPLLLGAWKIIKGRGINPSYVERIQDGKTKKHEILTLFGDPQEIKRTSEGVVYVYKSFRDKDAGPRLEGRKFTDVQQKPYLTDEDLKELDKTSIKQQANKELASTLIIRFQPDGETVQSHDYKEF